jgi:hypothetical protein
LRPAEFEELGNIHGSGGVEEEADYLHDVAGVVFEQGAANVAEFLNCGLPPGAGVEKHFDAFEGFGFFFGLGVAAPWRPVLSAVKQALEG